MDFKIIAVICLAISLILSIYFVKTALDVYGNRSALFEAQESLDEAKKLQDEYKKELNYRKTDEFVINEAREKLNYGFEGEQIVIIPQQGSTSELNEEVSPTPQTTPVTKQSSGLGKNNEPIFFEWIRVFTYGAKGEI